MITIILFALVGLIICICIGVFKSMFDSMNLNKEYLRWAKKITPNGSGIAVRCGLNSTNFQK